MDRAMGSLTPYSFVPHMVLQDYTDDMNFLQRCHNFAFSLVDAIYRKFVYMPAMDRMAREHFGHLEGPLPSVAELENSIAVILVNNHFAMTTPRPLMPGMVNIAGAHIKPLKPLPDDLQQFLDGADHGAIYMSLGSFMQSSMMPKEKMVAILKVFGSLKQRIIWKFDSDDSLPLPSNVIVRKWLPQSDILAHPKLLLFIGHGGLFETIEGSYRGLPILFMPFFGDQFRNAMLAKSKGYGRKILFTELTEESFKSEIVEMITNKSYMKNANEVASLLKDNPYCPIDDAIWWIEHAAKGTKHLKSAAINLSWYQYLLLDVVFMFVLLLWLMWKVIRAAQVLLFLRQQKRSVNFSATEKKSN